MITCISRKFLTGPKMTVLNAFQIVACVLLCMEWKWLRYVAMSQVPELELDKASLLPNPAQLKDKRDLQKSSHVYHNCILNDCIRGLNNFYFIATYRSVVL